METTLVKENSSSDIEDWIVEAESPDITKHDQLMCAWYTAMKKASELTSLPPPWEENPREDSMITGETTEAELPLLCAEEYFAFDEISASVPSSISVSVHEKISDQQAASLIYTDPEKILEARKRATQRKAITRKARLRHAHLERIDRLKMGKSQRGEGVIDMQVNKKTCSGIQTLPPIEDFIPASSTQLAPMNDHWLAKSDGNFEPDRSDTLEHIIPPTPETNKECQSAPAEPSPLHNSHDSTNQDPALLTSTNNAIITTSPHKSEAASLQKWWTEQTKKLSIWLDNTNKPPHTYPQLARMALLSNAPTPLSSAEIRHWISEHFAYYRCTEVPWRHGINSCLSACESFVVVDEYERGVANRWMLAVRPGGLGEGDMEFFLSTGRVV